MSRKAANDTSLAKTKPQARSRKVQAVNGKSTKVVRASTPRVRNATASKPVRRASDATQPAKRRGRPPKSAVQPALVRSPVINTELNYESEKLQAIDWLVIVGVITVLVLTGFGLGRL